MTPLTNMSRKAIVGISLAGWFAPFVPWLFLYFAGSHAQGIMHGILALPALSGLALEILFFQVFGLKNQPEWIAWIFGIALPFCFVVLMCRAVRWRLPFLIAELMLASGLSVLTYYYGINA